MVLHLFHNNNINALIYKGRNVLVMMMMTTWEDELDNVTAQFDI